jgi:hypothetical protein
MISNIKLNRNFLKNKSLIKILNSIKKGIILNLIMSKIQNIKFMKNIGIEIIDNDNMF